jgi:hypothetical protein
MSPRTALILWLAPTASALAPHAAAQVWVPLDPNQPPGTPAELRFLPAQSNASQSVFELELAGYWRSTLTGGDGLVYQRLEFPGLGELGPLGAPELPALRPRLCVANSAPLLQLVATQVDPGDTSSVSLRLYPEPKPARDGEDPGPGDTQGLPEQFTVDPLAYAQNSFVPADRATVAAPVGSAYGVFRAATVELFPVRYHALQQLLRIDRLTRYTYAHPGTPPPAPPLTEDKGRLGAASFLNWPAQAPFLPIDAVGFGARYLIVTPQALVPALEPFVHHRRTTGFEVTVRTLESLSAPSCTAIRAAIAAWYQSGPVHHDHYCLLVGDLELLPHCPSPTVPALLGDDAYGSPSGVGDLDEELFVGRLSVDDAAELTQQVQKILAYELDTTVGHPYQRALLVADAELQPGGYAAAQDAVAAASYTVPPDFLKLYGGLPGVTDDSILDAVKDGAGYVAYRGHGSTNSWAHWNLLGQYFHVDDVAMLANVQLPVVWSLSCTTQNLALDAGLGETWLGTAGGAVAHYGANHLAGTEQNHTLAARLFEGLFERGLTKHGQLLAWAEDLQDRTHPGTTYQNSWMSFLLGDPAQHLRRGPPDPLLLSIEPSPILGGPGATFRVRVTDTLGVPQAGVLVCAYAPSFFPGGPDALFTSATTGSGGTVVFPAPAQLTSVDVSARDDDGNIAVGGEVIQVGAFVNLGDGLAGALGYEPRLSSLSDLEPGQFTVVHVSDAVGFSAGLLAISFQDNPLPLFGGLVHPLPPDLQVPFTTDESGAFAFVIGPWPAGIPADTELYWQAGIVDPGGPQGLALTNALRSTTP